MLIRRKLITSLASAALLTAVTSPVFAEDQSLLTLWKEGDAGEKLNLRGRVISTTGKPIPQARVAFRQADGNTVYSEQYQGALFTADNGTFNLRSVVPGQYNSAKHIHIFVYAEGFQALQTELLFKGDPNISFGNSGGIEVLLEQVHKGEDVTHTGGVEIKMRPLQ